MEPPPGLPQGLLVSFTLACTPKPSGGRGESVTRDVLDAFHTVLWDAFYLMEANGVNLDVLDLGYRYRD